jgi:hypothetical protein
MLRKLRQLVRQHRPSKATVVDIEPPKFKTIEGPRKGSMIGYAVAVLLALAGGYWLFNSGTAQDRPPDLRGVSSSAPKSSEAVTSATGNLPSKKTATPADCCEWVRPSTRSDGTPVDGYWRSKAGCAEVCPLATKAKESTSSQKPPIHVGPRGGRFHYSKNGKKVYEHRK